MRFQWLRNGVAIVAATNSTLSINHLLATQGSTYSLIASNDFGATTNIVAVPTLEIPYLSFEPRLTNAALRLWLQGPPGQTSILESASDLGSWTALLTNVRTQLESDNWLQYSLRILPVHRKYPPTALLTVSLTVQLGRWGLLSGRTAR